MMEMMGKTFVSKGRQGRGRAKEEGGEGGTRAAGPGREQTGAELAAWRGIRTHQSIVVRSHV